MESAENTLQDRQLVQHDLQTFITPLYTENTLQNKPSTPDRTQTFKHRQYKYLLIKKGHFVYTGH